MSSLSGLPPGSPTTPTKGTKRKTPSPPPSPSTTGAAAAAAQALKPAAQSTAPRTPPSKVARLSGQPDVSTPPSSTSSAAATAASRALGPTTPPRKEAPLSSLSTTPPQQGPRSFLSTRSLFGSAASTSSSSSSSSLGSLHPGSAAASLLNPHSSAPARPSALPQLLSLVAPDESLFEGAPPASSAGRRAPPELVRGKARTTLTPEMLKYKLLSFYYPKQHPSDTFARWVVGTKIGEGQHSAVFRVRNINPSDMDPQMVIKILRLPVLEVECPSKIQSFFDVMMSNYKATKDAGIPCPILYSSDGPTVWEHIPFALNLDWNALTPAHLAMTQEQIESIPLDQLKEYPALLQVKRALGIIYKLTRGNSTYNADPLADNFRMRADGTVILADFMEHPGERGEFDTNLKKYLLSLSKGNREVWNYLCPSPDHTFEKIYPGQ